VAQVKWHGLHILGFEPKSIQEYDVMQVVTDAPKQTFPSIILSESIHSKQLFVPQVRQLVAVLPVMHAALTNKGRIMSMHTKIIVRDGFFILFIKRFFFNIRFFNFYYIIFTNLKLFK
jgi:hypothetical protein